MPIYAPVSNPNKTHWLTSWLLWYISTLRSVVGYLSGVRGYESPQEKFCHTTVRLVSKLRLSLYLYLLSSEFTGVCHQAQPKRLLCYEVAFQGFCAFFLILQSFNKRCLLIKLVKLFEAFKDWPQPSGLKVQSPAMFGRWHREKVADEREG